MTGQEPGGKWMVRGGWVLSILPALMLVMSGVMKLVGGEAIESGFAHLGWPASSATMLGVLELACVALFLMPQTAVLGAILVTGYLGGAIATHVRLEEAFAVPLLLGVLVWAGLYLRDARLRALIPLRRPHSA